MAAGAATSARPLTVLHVVESWPPVVSGYTTRSRELLLAQVAAPALDPRVLVTSRQRTYGASRIDVPAALEPRVRGLEPSPSERAVRRVRGVHVSRRPLTRAIRAAAQTESARVIHVHWSSGIGAAAAAAARGLELPLVAEVRFDLAGATMAQTVRIGGRPLERALRRHFEAHLGDAAAVVAASDSLAALLRDELPAVMPRLTVVPNGVDTARFAPGSASPGARAALGAGDRDVLVGSTAKMLRYEGLDLLVRALARLRAEGVRIRGALVGDGPQRAALERLAERCEAPVVFRGTVPPGEVPELLRALDVFAVPRLDTAVTRHAGPVKLLEAMACGVACTGSAVGDVASLLTGGRGVLLRPGSVGDLSGALRRLAGDPVRRRQLGGAARAWVGERHRWAATAEAYERVYAAVVR